MTTIPKCSKCQTYMGLSVSGTKASWLCPTHGSQIFIELSALNGHYDHAKLGGTD